VAPLSPHSPLPTLYSSLLRRPLTLLRLVLQCSSVTHRLLISECLRVKGAMASPSVAANTTSAPETLQVYLLSPPRAEWSGTVLSVPRRQVRALLYRLAAQPEPVFREQLAFLFWPDTPDSQARRNLSRLLTHLRRALPTPDLLLASRDRIGLDFEHVWSDFIAFTRLSDRGDEIESLGLAADLYRGSFLAGFSLPCTPEFEAWLLQQQRDAERRYLDVLTALIEKHAARQEYDAAIAYARRYLAADELAESVHGRLIALYVAAGDRAAALHQFERCTAILERELGVRPLPETRAVYQSALDGRSSPIKPTTPDLSWATLPGLDVPLVGRDAAYRRLSKALSEAQVGRGQVVLISGEPGIGKSRLMEEFAGDLGDRAFVLAVAARTGKHPLPYHPVAEIFRSIPDWHRLTSGVQPIWLAEAARLLPELSDLHPDLPPPLPVEPDEARARLLESLCRMMLGLATEPRPLLLCLDDLHWADSATLDWLFCLARRVASRRAAHSSGTGRPVLILGTYRTAEQDAVDELRNNLQRLGILSELRLAGLDCSAALEIVRHLTGPRPGSVALSRRLHRATGGNPFFLLETLRVLLEAGELPQDLTGLDKVPLPDTVRQAIENRLRRLEPRARQILEAGAVLGTSFDFDLVRRTAGRGEIEAVDALDDAVVRQLLVEEPPGYRFRHALIRQTLEAALGPVRHHLLHRRAARALERVDPQPVARIARHFDLGGEPERALRYYCRAARQAEDLFAWKEAEKTQGRMLALLDRLDPDCSQPEYLALRGHVLTSRAHLRFLQGRPEDRDADLAALAALAESNDDDELRLRTILHRVRYLNLGGRYKDAIAQGGEGLVIARRLQDTVAQSRLLAHVGFAHYFLGQPQPALVALQSAIDLSGGEMDLGMRGRISHILGYVHYHLGNYSRALDYQQEAHACSREMGDRNRVAWNLMDVGFLHLKLGRFGEARDYLTDSLALARRIAARPAEAYALTLLGDWELYCGSYAVALDRYQESRVMQLEVGSKHGTVAAENGAGFALCRLGHLDRARQTLRRALEHAREIGHQRHVALALIRLGLVELAAGSPSVAHDLLTEALTVARESECAENVAAGLAALARTERKRAHSTAALGHAVEAVRLAQTQALPSCRAWAELEVGLALLAQEKPQLALDHTTQAVERLPHMHEAWIGTQEVHRAHARVLRALDRTEEAREQVKLAEAVIQSKADRISDPDVRQRYLEHVQREASNLKS
jgi:DNA-binding SARP family transcriptional activator